MKNNVLRIISAVLLLVLTASCFAGCSLRDKDTAENVVPIDISGSERETGGPSNPDDTTKDTAPATEASTTPAGPAPAAGKVSRPADLASINMVSRAYFPDSDMTTGTWYPGKTSYDPATGEITTTFERSQETLDLLDKYGAIYLKNSDQKVCYLTFDCGYENGVTGQILDTLAAKNVKGCFFVTGDYIKSAPDLLKRMLNEGHIVGTHTVSHKNMADLSDEQFIEEILGNEELLKAAVPDAPDMVYYRPPMGGASEWALAMAQGMGLTTVFWSFAYYDYDVDNQWDVWEALQNAESGLRPGCVYLLHAVSTTNATMLGDLIDFIRDQGYEIRRIDQ